jgi:CheY-like chemotaxis protein
MKILLIDDEANNGWKEIIEKVFFENLNISATDDLIQAKKLVAENKYDMIFLDLRFGENDHKSIIISEFAGYKLLIDHIRHEISAVNFSTPVIVFSASNKIWNIHEMLNQGADDYYIKEHPDFAYDIEFSRSNYVRIKKNIPNLLRLGNNRGLILQKILNIIDLAKVNILNSNIQDRITEKLKIGFALLFRKSSNFEASKLLFNNEINAFIVFWSILEEISSDFFNRIEKKPNEWMLKKTQFKVQYFEDNMLCTYFDTIKETYNPIKRIDISRDNNIKYIEISLSNQIAAILRYQFNWTSSEIKVKFLDKFNKYRNEIDFIHSNPISIREKKLSDNSNSDQAFSKCLYLLDFLIDLLK